MADDFSRWTVGSDRINHKADWVEGVREWFDDGWRVADREGRLLDLSIRGGHWLLLRVDAHPLEDR